MKKAVEEDNIKGSLFLSIRKAFLKTETTGLILDSIIVTSSTAVWIQTICLVTMILDSRFLMPGVDAGLGGMSLNLRYTCWGVMKRREGNGLY